jgi:hypothetical protein
MKRNSKIIATVIAAATVLTISSYNFGRVMAGEDFRIPYPAGYDTTSSGASSYQNSGDHKDSKYFIHNDYYNMKSDSTLTIIPKYKTYQQTTEWSCGPSAALMVLDHYGVTKWDELKIGATMKSDHEVGTSTDKMVSFFKGIGWDVKSSLTEGKIDGGYTFKDPEKIKNWIISNVKEGTPIMVEWIDWGGHWQDIIGYDTMGTKGIGDDVLILADPYDTSDQWQDGYYTFPAERFIYMWFDAHMLPDNQKNQQWVIAKPAK